MALQTDGYNADTEGSNNSPLQNDSDEEMEDEKDPEGAQIVLERLDLNGGPPFLARDYMSGDDFSDYSIESVEDPDSDYDDKPGKHKKRKRRVYKRVKCDECNRRFATKAFMLKHKAVHSGEFTCPKCDKKCASAGTLRIHQRIHTGERPFSCEECDKAFAFKLQLMAHVDRDHGDGFLSFACDECDRAFYKEMHLIRHQLTHKKRAYECLFCGKGFMNNAPLRAHIQRVHRAQPSDTPGDGGRRSGRTTRVDYRDDVINVEDTADEPKRKRRPAKGFAIKEVPNRLRQRDGAPVAAKAGKGKKRRRPMYTGAGTQPTRESSRRTKAVDYAIKEEEESEDEDTPPRRGGRPRREAEAENGQEEDESDEDAKPVKGGRGRGLSKKKAESEDEEEDEEPKKTVRGRGRQKVTAPEEEEEEEEPEKTSQGRGRPTKRQPPTKRAHVSEDEDEEEAEAPKETPRGRGQPPVKRRSLAERLQDEDEEAQQSPKKTPGRGRPQQALAENGEEDSDEEANPPAKKATPRGRGRAVNTTVKEDDSDEDDAAAAENGASDASDAESTPKAPVRRGGRAAAATPKTSSIRGSGRRSTAVNISFAENSESESDGDGSDEEAGSRRASGRSRRARDDSESRVPPKKRLRGRQ